jgi:hypothetical protein
MPRILAPNHSFQRRGSQHSLSSRTSLNSEPPLRRSSLTSTRGYKNAAYESAFSLSRQFGGTPHRQTFDVYRNTNDITQQSKQNAEWETRLTPKTFSKDSFNTTATTQASSQCSSISTLPSTNETSSSGLAAAFALMMQQKAGGGGGGVPNRRYEPQSAPCSPKAASSNVSSFVPYHIIKEEPDSWGQFVDVQSKDEDLNKRSRVVRRYPGAPHSLPRAF